MVLKEFAHRISRHMRNFDLVARIGGEEFLVILPDVDVGMVGTIASRLCAVIADEPMICGPDGTQVNVTTSVGVTLAGDGLESVDAVLKRADTALYRAKNAVATGSRRNGWTIRPSRQHKPDLLGRRYDRFFIVGDLFLLGRLFA